jgi:hypothetical protein
MATPSVLVVGETPSLGRSIVDLFDSAGIANEFVHDLAAETTSLDLGRQHPVVVVASNGPFCASARGWGRGAFPDVAMVVVGSRDPLLRDLPKIQVIPLPFLPGRLLAVVQRLLPSSSPQGDPAPPGE